MRVCAYVDTQYGLLSESRGQDASNVREELMAQYSERQAARVAGWAERKDVERRELWRLFLELGDGRYFCVHELFVGLGPDVLVRWEAWVADEEDGVARPFTWALLRRSFGTSEVVSHGTAHAHEPACWVPLEASVGGCMPGDVLVLWLGVLDGGGARHSVSPYVRNVRLLLRQSDEDRALMLKQRRPMPRPVAYASGNPMGTMQRNVAWGL
jgi:hypothetical protein